MSSEDKKKIAQWAKTLKHDIDLELIITDDERSESLKRFGDFLKQCSPRINIKKTSETGIPCIRFNQVKYQMIPSERELEPFFKLLSDPEILAQEIPPQTAENLKGLSFLAAFKVYAMPGCIFCPKVVEQILGMAVLNKEIQPTIIDGSLFPELVQKDRIKSAPTVILDEQFRWSGAIDPDEIVGFTLNRNPAQLSASSLRSIIEEGKAVDLARMMMDHQKIFPEFLNLLIHDKWPVRLGAMVVFETMAENESDLIADIISSLWNKFNDVEDTVKGDILYLLGISRNENVILKIESVLKGDYAPEVMEAAQEAMDMIQ